MGQSYRIDRSALRPPQRLSDGRVRAEAHISRVGIQVYRNLDGSTRRELRSREEVFHPDSLASFQLLPITNDHPPDGSDVTAWNARKFMVGSTGENIVADDDHVKSSLMIADAATLSEMTSTDKVQVSCGYNCDLVEEPGVHPEFGPYDAIQTNIRGNHVAIVQRGRAGPTARVRMDGASMLVACDLDSGDSVVAPTLRGNSMDPKDDKIMLEEAAKQLAAAKARADSADAKLSSETARADRAQGEADGLRDEVKRLKEGRIDADEIKRRDEVIAEKAREIDVLKKRVADAEDPKRLDAAVMRRVHILKHVANVLGNDKKYDACDNRALMCSVIERLHGTTVDAKAHEEYVQARFDAAVEGFQKTASALDELRDTTRELRELVSREDKNINHHDAYVASQQNAWKEAQAASGKAQ